MLCGRRAFGSLFWTVAYAAAGRQSHAEIPDKAGAPSYNSYDEALRSVVAKHSLDDAWFYLRRDSGETLAFTHGKNSEIWNPLHVGSLSKSVTAIGIALLIQDGRLTLQTRLVDVLSDYVASKHHQLNPSLGTLDVEHVLAHRAGLRSNTVADPLGGISSTKVLAAIRPDAHFSDYLLMSGADSSDGTSEYRYSNLSYIILGMVIEAVSGEAYDAFCQRRIFSPLQIAAQIAPDLRRVAPFAGWAISAPDMLRVWTVFDIDHPSLLTRETLEATLFSRDLPPIVVNSHTYYTVGTLVTQDTDKSGYALRHDGIVDFCPTVRVSTRSWKSKFPALDGFSSTRNCPSSEDLIGRTSPRRFVRL